MMMRFKIILLLLISNHINGQINYNLFDSIVNLKLGTSLNCIEDSIINNEFSLGAKQIVYFSKCCGLEENNEMFIFTKSNNGVEKLIYTIKIFHDSTYSIYDTTIVGNFSKLFLVDKIQHDSLLYQINNLYKLIKVVEYYAETIRFHDFSDGFKVTLSTLDNNKFILNPFSPINLELNKDAVPTFWTMYNLISIEYETLISTFYNRITETSKYEK